MMVEVRTENKAVLSRSVTKLHQANWVDGDHSEDRRLIIHLPGITHFGGHTAGITARCTFLRTTDWKAARVDFGQVAHVPHSGEEVKINLGPVNLASCTRISSYLSIQSRLGADDV